MPPLPSKKRMPAVQLLAMSFSATVMPSVVLRKMMPVRLLTIWLLRIVWLPELLMSMPERLPVMTLSRMTAPVMEGPWMATPAVFRPGLFHVAKALPSRVMVKPEMTTLFAVIGTWHHRRR